MAKLRVLVVEDHPATARGLKMFLEMSDCEVAVASDVRSALQFARANKFDVMVCDLNLPDGTGWHLMKRLSKRAPVRAIAFSAFDEPDQVARSAAAGFVEHVVKGCTPEELLAAVRRAAARLDDQPGNGMLAAAQRRSERLPRPARSKQRVG